MASVAKKRRLDAAANAATADAAALAPAATGNDGMASAASVAIKAEPGTEGEDADEAGPALTREQLERYAPNLALKHHRRVGSKS